MNYPRYKIVLAALDYCILAASFAFATALAYKLNDLPIPNFEGGIFTLDYIFIGLYSLLLLFIFQAYHLYKINVIYNRSQQLVFLLKSFVYCLFGLVIIAFFTHIPPIVAFRETVVFMTVIGLVNVSLFRIVLLPFVMKYVYQHGADRKNLLVIGSPEDAKRVAIQFELGSIYGLNLVGFILEGMEAGEKVFKDKITLGTVADIPRLVGLYQIDEILLASSHPDYEDLFKTLDICKSSRAHIVISSGLVDVINNKLFTEKYFDIPVVRMKDTDNSQLMMYAKRCVDLTGALLGIVLLSPIIAFIMLAIKFSSKGPIIFKQTRVGKDGKEFTFFKFRSMVTGSDKCSEREKAFGEYIHQKQNTNEITKIVDESKITSIGRFLRKTSLDELPQLINVLRGEMSLVGPRPCLPYEWNAYDEWHKRRMSVLPGCTGLWQVLSRAKGSFDDMVLLDIYYINNMSPWFDIQLILKTIPVMVLGRGGK